MDIILKLEQLFKLQPNIIKVNNFYFERHFCDVTKEEIKIDLNLEITNASSNEVNLIGYCPHCNTLFYNKDYK